LTLLTAVRMGVDTHSLSEVRSLNRLPDCSTAGMRVEGRLFKHASPVLHFTVGAASRSLCSYKLGRRTPSSATLDPSQRIWLGASQPSARALKLVSPWLGWVRVRLALAGGWPPLFGADQP
jgi:hypothetical protein